jgi:uncharacterized protein (DUF1697 family)
MEGALIAMRFVALVRALNVGGTGKLAMSDLIDSCEQAGFTDAKTYIQSGNVVFESAGSEPKVKAALEKSLAKKMGGAIDVLVRSHKELTALLAKNPFADAAPNQVVVFFLDEPPKKDELAAKGADGERVHAFGRDVFVHYPNGQGRSKLKLAFVKRSTGRNLNTVRKLAELSA